MRGKKISIGFILVLAILAATLLMVSTVAAQTETLLHSFKSNGKDGTSPCGSLIFDASGNLYGTTTSGGADNDGTVYELSPKAGGGWTEKGLYTFGNGSGAYPYGNVVFDAAGNLYGTTDSGGAYDFGTVYELTPKTGGGWNEKTLHSFGNNMDGRYPNGGLIFDAAGNLYGTAEAGGPHNSGGIVFELSPKTGAAWTEKALHSFGSGKDGAEPVGNLIFDAAGNLYGATYFGGAFGQGTVFELSPATGGGWTEKGLHSFEPGSTDGGLPTGSLIFDGAGNLYGISYKGGVGNVGTVFELSPAAGGTWTSAMLHSFNDNGVDGFYPQGGLIFDASGNLYGTASEGGADNAGVVFEMTPGAGGSWTETLLRTFNGADGKDSCSGMIFDGSGNLYGTTSAGGAGGSGVVFEITP